MLRSEINRIIRDADAFLSDHRFHLPPFADWSLDDWRRRAHEAGDIIDRGLGWDITDFGLGDYRRTGLFLFTIRNGSIENLNKGRGKLYAEKALIVDVDQVTPLHRHKVKTEDIINRGGGVLVVRLYNATPDGGLDDGIVEVVMDGLRHRVNAGDTVALAPGESITLEPGCYHAFWAAESKALVGEVSLVNDDNTDNYFYEPVGRFPTIEEDEPPLRLLVKDYAALLQEHAD